MSQPINFRVFAVYSIFCRTRRRCAFLYIKERKAVYSILEKHQSMSAVRISFNTQTCNSDSWSTYSCGRISTLVENCCPILMNVGPNLKRLSFSHLARTFLLIIFFSSVIPPAEVDLELYWRYTILKKHVGNSSISKTSKNWKHYEHHFVKDMNPVCWLACHTCCCTRWRILFNCIRKCS